MIHEEKKVAKIIEELTMYFFALGADEMSSGIQRKDNQVTITFRSNYQSDFEYKLDHLEEYLREPKNEGIEDIYWELAGSGDPGETSQLLLLGMMIDKAKVTRGDGVVELTLYKELFEETFF